MQFENIFGVKVDVRIPEEDKEYFRGQWRDWIEGRTKGYDSLQERNLKTRYEHFILGSGVGIPPDPFKPLAAQANKADLEAVIEARKKMFPPGEEYRESIYASFMIENFEKLIGFHPETCRLIGIRPKINEDGRIHILKIVGVYHSGKTLNLSDELVEQLQLPTINIKKVKTGTIIKENFDFSNGYCLEYVEV